MDPQSRGPRQARAATVARVTGIFMNSFCTCERESFCTLATKREPLFHSYPIDVPLFFMNSAAGMAIAQIAPNVCSAGICRESTLTT